ncbi:rhodanese-like domain-containing protein [Alteromonas facilis]|uniref:rhodanese-like domain-containing protein n=1 Tax=Alteromonas facilis TaxID=2048004 RepID=UPI000C28BF32|nr:rhodanese-like domain-containing protein [Alteromonas facilis]
MKSPKEYVDEVKALINEVSVGELTQLLKDSELVLIDIREHEEYVQGHVANSVNLPRGVLEMKLTDHPVVAHHSDPNVALADLAQRPIYLICRSGGRSALAAQSLTVMGHPEVYSVAGGMLEWEKQGLATTK